MHISQGQGDRGAAMYQIHAPHPKATAVAMITDLERRWEHAPQIGQTKPFHSGKVAPHHASFEATHNMWVVSTSGPQDVVLRGSEKRNHDRH